MALTVKRSKLITAMRLNATLYVYCVLSTMFHVDLRLPKLLQWKNEKHRWEMALHQVILTNYVRGLILSFPMLLLLHDDL